MKEQLSVSKKKHCIKEDNLEKVPTLRFSEFNGNWKETKIENIIKKGKAGGTPKSTIKEYYGGNIPFLSINDMTTQGKYIFNAEKSITSEGLENSSAWIVPKNSLLYSMYASIGFVSINNIELATSQAIYSMILNDNIDIDFIYYSLENFKKYVHKYIETGTQGNLNSKIVKNIPINLPNIREQIKISKFISIIDKKIELLEKTLCLYQKYTLGVKNSYFDNLKTDNVVKFKEIIKKGKAGGTPKSTIKEYYGGNIPFLSINDMTSQGKHIQFTEKFITFEGLNNSSAWIVPKNSLLYSMYASIGFVAINDIELATSQAIYSIILKEEVNQKYIYHYLMNFKRFVHKYIETGTQGNLNSKIVQNIEIKLPSLEEQEYYSKVFDTLDKKIGMKEKEIFELNKFKKGLLQQMFV